MSRRRRNVVRFVRKIISTHADPAGFAEIVPHPGQNMKDPLRDTKGREGGLQQVDERDQAVLMAEISNSSVILSLTSTPPASSAAL
ncbi:MAG: hypothetical protein QOJ37_2248 [Pseudonocardiales bacterium]|nr:hypothetical protein [Pseudonocardiales bacterium]